MGSEAACLQCGKTYDSSLVVNRFAGVCPACLAKFAAAESGEVEPSPGLPDPSLKPPLKVGGTFHGLEIVELLGAGGMGVVYKARQPGLDRFVALKVLSPKLSSDPEFVARFNREAKAMAALSHPGIVQVFDFGSETDLCFLVMEYVDGPSLRHVMKDRLLAPDQALKIVPQICEALEYAHSERVIHRDIKPENILVDKKGRVKIADFGLAKLLVEDAGAPKVTITNVVMGTPGYMAPEQLQGLKVDHRADIYSLGAVFYEMLTGEVPLGRFEAPSKRVQVDVRLDEVVLKALEKEPDRRYQRAMHMSTAITKIQAAPTEAPSAAPSAAGTRVISKTAKAGPVLIMLFFILFAAAAILDDRSPVLSLLAAQASVISLALGFAAGLWGLLVVLTSRGRVGGLPYAAAAIAAGVLTWVSPIKEIADYLPMVETRPRPAEQRRHPAGEHGTACPEIEAAAAVPPSSPRSEALIKIARRSGLTPHEQMFLVDATVDSGGFSHHQAAVLLALARNTGLAASARDHVRARSRELRFPGDRRQVMDALDGSED